MRGNKTIPGGSTPLQTTAVALMMLAVMLLGWGCQDQATETPPASVNTTPQEAQATEHPPVSSEAGVIAVSSDNFDQEVLQAEALVVLDFWAEWCDPCKVIERMLEAWAEEYAGRVKFVSVNIDESGELYDQYKVRALPCVILFEHGKEIGRLVGARAKTDLKDQIDQHVQRAE